MKKNPTLLQTKISRRLAATGFNSIQQLHDAIVRLTTVAIDKRKLKSLLDTEKLEPEKSDLSLKFSEFVALDLFLAGQLKAGDFIKKRNIISALAETGYVQFVLPQYHVVLKEKESFSLPDSKFKSNVQSTGFSSNDLGAFQQIIRQLNKTNKPVKFEIEPVLNAQTVNSEEPSTKSEQLKVLFEDTKSTVVVGSPRSTIESGQFASMVLHEQTDCSSNLPFYFYWPELDEESRLQSGSSELILSDVQLKEMGIVSPRTAAVVVRAGAENSDPFKKYSTYSRIESETEDITYGILLFQYRSHNSVIVELMGIDGIATNALSAIETYVDDMDISPSKSNVYWYLVEIRISKKDGLPDLSNIQRRIIRGTGVNNPYADRLRISFD